MTETEERKLKEGERKGLPWERREGLGIQSLSLCSQCFSRGEGGRSFFLQKSETDVFYPLNKKKRILTSEIKSNFVLS